MDPVFKLLLFQFVLLIVWFWLRGRRARKEASSASGVSTTGAMKDVYSFAAELESFFERTAHPRDLIGHDVFEKGVGTLMTPNFDDDALIVFGKGENLPLACMAFEALHRRENDVHLNAKILHEFHRVVAWPMYFAFRALHRVEGQSLIAGVLADPAPWWGRSVIIVQLVREFISERLADGETLAFERGLEDHSAEQLETCEQFIDALAENRLEPLVEELKAWRAMQVDIGFLNSFGSVWQPEASRPVTVLHDAFRPVLDEAWDSLTADESRSVLLVGERGVGKTALTRLLSERLFDHGWTVFEARSIDLVAGQVYVGQIEERIQQLTRELAGGKKIVWFIPDFYELRFAGSYKQNPRGVLDMLLPFIDSGSIRVVGEAEPEAFERLQQSAPRLRTAMKAVTIRPMSRTRTLELAEAWSEARHVRMGMPKIEPHVLQEAFYLANQYLDEKAAPGNLIELLELAQGSAAGAGTTQKRAVTLEHLLQILAQLTGLPVELLDDRQGLDLEALRSLFKARVLGQPEAVDCLVERVAMMKAGLHDPSRPAGVFLFVGPTGTGKTEIAKTLAKFLFGSPERMIRLDMSEFNSERSLSRLVGDGDMSHDAMALVNLIRKQPFSVVLLDEFEKAHPQIWDLFLQVFDDGRLTDQRGHVADFRHSIIIMTSNLGAAVPHGVGIGFSDAGPGFSAGTVSRTVQQTFRPEFLNRIDRTVVFRPLSRSVVRDILLKELDDVLKRRGLRNRDWAVEWEESALDFLLEKGFTAELGARPLKRAIERYVLSPLAITIVNNQFPEGDQFLFVRSNGKELEVEFIDPDAEQPAVIAPVESAEEIDRTVLKTIVLEAMGTPAEVEILRGIYEGLADEVASETWRTRKDSALAQTMSPEFWESPDRFGVLNDIEYMDRLERAMDTADSLMERVSNAEERQKYPTKLITRLAQRLYVVEAALESDGAGLGREAFLMVQPSQDTSTSRQRLDWFTEHVITMYERWGERRQMRPMVLQPYQEGRPFVIAFAGLGAHSILKHEAGLHVWEEPASGKSFKRAKVQVRVVPQPEQLAQDAAGQLQQALEAFNKEAKPSRTIVRRYRRDPSPLVRDSIRGWRSGKLGDIFEGHFDVMLGT